MDLGNARRIGWVAVALVLGAAVVVSGLWMPACSRSAGRTPGPVRAVVSIAPLDGLVRRLMPADAEVTLLITPGRSEHGYELTAADAAALRRADLVAYVGLGLEATVIKYLSGNPAKSRHDFSFASAVGVKDESGHEGHDHGHGEEGHHHGAVDPHLWLDPSLIEKLIPVLRAEVEMVLRETGAWSAQAGQRLDAAEADLLKDVRAVDAEYRMRLEALKGREIVTDHAAWSRLADRYGLKVAAVVRPIEGVEPPNDHILNTVKVIRERKIGVIFVEPQFSEGAARRIAELTGARIGRLDPLGTGDWFDMMRTNLESLIEHLSR